MTNDELYKVVTFRITTKYYDALVKRAEEKDVRLSKLLRYLVKNELSS